MWGAATHDRATGVHRPLRATVAAFAPLVGEDLQVVLALDHCVMGAQELRELKERAAKGGGVDPAKLLIVFSHTHAAGLMGLDRVGEPGGELIRPYLEKVGQTAGELIRQVVRSLLPVTIVYGSGHCGLAAHRDFWDAERSQFVCGFNPGVKADDTLIVARIKADDGSLSATVVNYACHPTTLAWENTKVSPDFIGAMREVLERETGAPCLFLQGASGELGPREGFVGDAAVADRNGRELGFAALSTLMSLPPPSTKYVYQGPVISGATLGTWRHVELDATERSGNGAWAIRRWEEPLKYRPGRPTVESVRTEMKKLEADEEAAKKSGDHVRAGELRALVERKNRLLHRIKQLPEGESFPLQVLAMRIGGAVWLGAQGESYSLLQTELRKRFPDYVIVVASIASDWGASYLPTRDTYDKGIYQESIAVVAAGSLEQLIESAASKIKELLG